MKNLKIYTNSIKNDYTLYAIGHRQPGPRPGGPRGPIPGGPGPGRPGPGRPRSIDIKVLKKVA